MTTSIELSDRYQLHEEVGAGGMARVFLGHDHKHDRTVAIKILRPELSLGMGEARFLQEIRFAARLNHPHILPLFDSGEADGHLYFVMPFVDGPSLRTRLAREGPIPIEAAADLVRNVAAALDYAHAHDVVHRDIKPENIMIHNGVAVVTDFGIGKALSPAAGKNYTQAGAPIGTPAYMSPEQLAGDPNVDGRTDIYGLACVLFEMLSGGQPFQARTPEAAIAARFRDGPPDVERLGSSVPESVRQAIVTALSVNREDRFATAGGFAAALVFKAGPPKVRPPPVTARKEPSIAVLPFANMSADPDNEYFSDGISEEIINALAKVKNLRVPARTSSFAFKGKELDIAKVGTQLNVDKVLEGSVRRAGSRVRITAKLINVADGFHLWSERYDREMHDVFEVQDEIAESIVGHMKVMLTETSEARRVRRATDNVEAYNLYLKGRFLWNRRTEEALKSAAECFERAIELDPKYALAYAGLADVYLLQGSYLVISRDDAQAGARQAASKALALDETLAEAHTSMGQVYRWELEWEAEERHYRRAIELNPGYATAHHWYAGLLQTLGRLDEALASVERAAELDPLSPAIRATVGQMLRASRRLEEARQHYEWALELEPNFITALANLADIYAALGRDDDSHRMVDRLLTIAPDHPARVPLLAFVYASLGRTEEARTMISEVEGEVDVGLLGAFYARIGEMDRAFECMARNVDERTMPVVLALKSNPDFDEYRDDPRYRRLLERLNLPVDPPVTSLAD